VAKGDGRLLALIPILVGVLLAALLFPHDSAPDDVPLPTVDARAIERTERSDDARVSRAASAGLSAEVRALGEALRAFDTAEAKDAPRTPWPELRAAVDEARNLALEKGGIEAILDLRATQTSKFVDEVNAWRKTGQESDELAAIGGAFIRRMTLAGYVNGPKLALGDRELRVAYKLKWNAVARFEDVPAFQPSLDEMRALYTFYILHPHASEAARETLAAARKNARTQADCDALEAGEKIAIEQWRLDKVEKLAAIDAAYPAPYARGVALYRAAKYDDSARAFEEWLRLHPDGPLTLRARNHLRAAIGASRAR
jgi:tetratricopeptide (TPR) repeat protein